MRCYKAPAPTKFDKDLVDGALIFIHSAKAILDAAKDSLDPYAYHGLIEMDLDNALEFLKTLNNENI